MGIGEQFEFEKTGRIEPENISPGIVAYFDGACEPVNPGGTASYGVAVLKDDQKIFEASEIFFPKKGHERETSNNVAEYCGLRRLLQFLDMNGHRHDEILIQGDSMLVIKQMRGEWRMRQGFYIPIAQECRDLLRDFTNVRFSWIPREQNTLADKLSKAELIKAGVKFRIQPE